MSNIHTADTLFASDSYVRVKNELRSLRCEVNTEPSYQHVCFRLDLKAPLQL